MIFWCQTNPKIRWFPAVHNVQDKTKKPFVWTSKSVLKIHPFKFICGEVFPDNLCLQSYLSEKINLTDIFYKLFWLFLRNIANHLWHLHVFWREDFFKIHSQVGYHKMDSFGYPRYLHFIFKVRVKLKEILKEFY